MEYLCKCFCLRKIKNDSADKNSTDIHLIFEKGDKKLGRELDIVNLVRAIRKLRLMAEVLLTPAERILLKFQRKNVIELTSSSSDSDHHKYDSVKLLNSKKDLIRLRQAIKIQRTLNSYKGKELGELDKNLLVGIFDRRPAKRYNIFEDEKSSSRADGGLISNSSDASTSLPLFKTMTLSKQLD